MKAKDLLRNAIVLKTQGQKGLSNRLTSLVRDIEFKGLSTLAAYVMALVDNERDPVVGLMRQASTDEMARKKLLGDAILKMSAFNKVLNMRFAVPGTLLMDADDPALAGIVAALPPKLIKGVRFKNPHLDRFDEVLTGHIPLAGYLESLSQYAKDHHLYKRAQAELHQEVEQGKDYNSFARMAFLQHEQQNEFAHSFRFEGEDGLRFAALKFSPKSEEAFAHTWYPQDIAKTYLFGHELGHCLTSSVLHGESYDQFVIDGNRENLTFREELFADIYSACLMAKITGSWDFLSLCILPFRASGSVTHNTFDEMQRLPKSGVDPKSFQALSDRDLVMAAENIYREFAHNAMSTRHKPLQDAAALMITYSHRGDLHSAQAFENSLRTAISAVGVTSTADNQQLVVQFMMKRLQAEIDLIGMRGQMGISSQWIRESLLHLSTTIDASGNAWAANNLGRIAGLEDDAMRSEMMTIMSEQALSSLENYEQTAMSIEVFWEDWSRDELKIGRKPGPLAEERALDH
ncbi:hypothetical protein RBE51_19535 [Pseudomonas taiwanensis]|uniref:hypothetical protein n=1 Tax=Pseudomonas taiwanensis TaxID=470150 RepID=UPI0028DD5C9C|nr:hypothetical protein [Pseudomonas taiwanensis]MDT8924984.1 hypothetical protein [Pseudomonas taiwanensis]